MPAYISLPFVPWKPANLRQRNLFVSIECNRCSFPLSVTGRTIEGQNEAFREFLGGRKNLVGVISTDLNHVNLSAGSF